MTTTRTTVSSPVALSPPTILVRERAPLLPKIAFVLISIASLVGTALSNRGLGVPVTWLVPRWGALWAGAAAVGFLAWRLLYLREAGGGDPGEYDRGLTRRARKVGRVLAFPALLTAPAALAVGYLDHRPGHQGALVVAAVVLAATLVAGADRRPTGWVGLAAAVMVTLGWAVADAGDGLPTLWRGLHLTAFGLWVGGALWNLTVAIPVGSRHATIDAVTSGALQLQRFRRVARAALPTIVVTGVLMALPRLTAPGDLLATPEGRFIVTKVGLIVALVVIFITCPLYRQCSPVTGVCDLDDLDEASHDPAADRVTT